MHRLYAADGRQWRFKAVRHDSWEYFVNWHPNSSIESLAQLPDGSLLILEMLNDGGLLGLIGRGAKEAHLRRVTLSTCQSVPGVPRLDECPVTDYPTSTGDPIRGSFEGIANISGDLFLLVTDETFGAELMLVRLPPLNGL